MDTETLYNELKYTASRSSGPGGQHANKVSSKVQLIFDLEKSKAFTEDEKQILFKNLKNRFTKDNILILSSDDSRSQHKNKEIVTDRFLKIIQKGLIVPKERKATKPKQASIKKRLDKKKKLAYKKALRRKPDLD
ncbi:MAG: alternative ribosome rescue aminoacyl-tRNA hydrolase ArfB [Bacteroidota bacterium]